MLDMVSLVVKHLRSNNLNYYTDLPPGVTKPAGRVQEIGVAGPSSHEPDWLYQYDLQVDVWADTKLAAHQTLSDASFLIRQHPVNEYGQVTRFEAVSVSYEPDESWPTNGQPSPHYLAVMRVWGHSA
jgi:hypothetical protein